MRFLSMNRLYKVSKWVWWPQTSERDRNEGLFEKVVAVWRLPDTHQISNIRRKHCAAQMVQIWTGKLPEEEASMELDTVQILSWKWTHTKESGASALSEAIEFVYLI